MAMYTYTTGIDKHEAFNVGQTFAYYRPPSSKGRMEGAERRREIAIVRVGGV